MREAIARAPANIAFIKYWGKKNEELRLPLNNSLSMNLSEIFTITRVRFNHKLKRDTVYIDGKPAKGKDKQRVITHINRIRHLGNIDTPVEVESKNNFPSGTGMASSASGFAALTMAAAAAANLRISKKRLSILARLGSGSACRSIPDGFVEWKTGEKSDDSYAVSIFPPNYWEIRDVIAVVGENSKKVSSTEGQVLSESSPFFRARIKGMKKKITDIKKAIEDKNFVEFGELLEAETINMHAVMMTSIPALYYWTPETLRIILAVGDWRDEGISCYFTIDAGPNVHVICPVGDAGVVQKKLRRISGVDKIIVNAPSAGAKLL
jgi:diphosphomevalonate decarboxylase